jgi:hypothetical protein
MKKFIKYLLVALTFIMLNFVLVTVVVAQDPPPPPQHGQTGNQVPGGGAAIGGGALILALLGVGYGAKKWYDRNKKSLVE